MPENGNGEKEQISIYVNSHLVKLLDNLAKKNERTRSIEAERAIRAHLLINMDSFDFWLEVYQKHGFID